MSRQETPEEGTSGPVLDAATVNTAGPPTSDPAVPQAQAVRNGSRRGRRRIILLGFAMVAAALFYWKGMPFFREYFSHVETDDAYVTGEASAVGSRISEVVTKVFVKDNDFVEKGTLLVALDRNVFQVQAAQKRAELDQQMLELQKLAKTLDSKRASLDQARDVVAMGIAGLHESIKAVEGKQDMVRYRIAVLRGAAASLRAAQSDLVLAQKDFDRVDHLLARQSATQSELDQRRSVLESNRQKVKASEQQVQQARAQLGLSARYTQPDQITEALEKTDTEVRRSVATGQQVLAQLGARFLKDLDPDTFRKAVSAFLARPAGWVDQVPSVRVAQGELDETLAALGGRSFDPARLDEQPSVRKLQKELEEAELKLSFTEIRAPVSGFVNRKSVNPGDHVQVGQALMAIQPLESVYIVANFKETQLSNIVIGQPVEICVDAYPERPLKGRVSGFAAATGAASSLLPAENATGNFVKVVQRLPVRIDLVEDNPHDTPLFVGMSVIPRIDIKDPPTGPDAGARLRSSEAVRTARYSKASEIREVAQ
jgi:membrane fusion protein, multidrug efflux system